MQVERLVPNLSLVFKKVSFSYNPSHPLFKSLDLELIDGEFVSLIGASGSGKTTILRLITGLEEPEQGHILINGQQLKKPPWFGGVYAPTRSIIAMAYRPAKRSSTFRT